MPLKLIQLEELHTQQELGQVSQYQTSSMQQTGLVKPLSNVSTLQDKTIYAKTAKL